MGRTQQSQGLAPPAIRKDFRAKQARHIINKVIPSILASNARARRGVDSSELIVDPGPVIPDTKIKTSEPKDKELGSTGQGEDETRYIKRKGQGRRKLKASPIEDEIEDSKDRKRNTRSNKRNPSIDISLTSLSLSAKPSPKQPLRTRILTTDPLTASHILNFPSQYDPLSSSSPSPQKQPERVIILSPASPLQPGSGVTNGSTSPESALCTHTTLLPSLHESFYRLPEYGGVYTPDVLVFRSPNNKPKHSPSNTSNTTDVALLPPGDRYFIDIITAATLRFPDLEESPNTPGNFHLSAEDRAIVHKKMTSILHIATRRSLTSNNNTPISLILPAWGCGSYGNPVPDIAQLWHSTVFPHSNKPSPWGTSIREIIFAIPSLPVARMFAEHFPSGELEGTPVNNNPSSPFYSTSRPRAGKGEIGESYADDDDDESRKQQEELKAKIAELEGQIERVWNQELKDRLGVVLRGLRAQVKEHSTDGEDDDEEEKISEDFDGDTEDEDEDEVDDDESNSDNDIEHR